ncbi:MAG: DedA family protein [Candidatus Nanopelagicales bacterium]|nr:DedA family protein [Candidatus Nanopelagicales bacterium]MDP4986270.1 DedA family protein [Candidatus Nanopelagicales bacterium]MDP5108085.1 DedA family protein [Candidatus Nanopelagicales bacterium]
MLPQAALDGQLNSWLDALGPFIFYLIVWGLVFVGTAFFVGAFVPFITGDSLLFAAGLIAASSANINVVILVTGVAIAAFFGDQVGFIIGRHYGRPYLDKRGGKKTQLAIKKTENFYNKYGWWAVVVARYAPWARVLIPAIAGIGRMNYYKFLSSNFVGAISWGVGITLTGFYAATIPAVKNAAYAIAAFFIIGSIVAGFRTWYLDRKVSS